ncbi:VOC family protein [Hyphomicrobium sp.]|uniref:VOC family protein n=1 Tax=Hyphomicrobium sp. TaxID=82 RepID=UPI002E34157A|nr:VOC family protein [Hyphomicrobium sp.]HEX2840110.1 VOC family protein [Hyphomicrobium sp.]
MTASSTLPAPNLMPLMRYRELAEAMGWLERAFGFEKQIAVGDNDGAIIYGQMTYRGSLMMMGAVRDTDLDKLMRQPDEVGGVETQSCYIVVDDADAHYTKALEAGAEIVLEIKSDGLGRRGYSCRDPEGHIWNFGTYNPGKGLSSAAVVALPAAAPAQESKPRTRQRLLMSVGALLFALGATYWWFANEIRSDLSVGTAQVSGYSTGDAERAYAELVKVRSEKRKADELVRTLNAQIETEKARRQQTEAEAKKAAESIGQEQNARRAAESAIVSLREELKREQEALESAIEARRISEEKLAVRTSGAESAKQTSNRKVAVRTEEGPPVPLVPPSSAADHTASSPPASASGIETSATERAKAGAQDDEDGPERADTERDKSSRRVAVKGWRKSYKAPVERPARILPTYVMGLHEVPWPYTTWYK